MYIYRIEMCNGKGPYQPEAQADFNDEEIYAIASGMAHPAPAAIPGFFEAFHRLSHAPSAYRYGCVTEEDVRKWFAPVIDKMRETRHYRIAKYVYAKDKVFGPDTVGQVAFLYDPTKKAQYIEV